jgi:hypothetical protein
MVEPANRPLPDGSFGASEYFSEDRESDQEFREIFMVRMDIYFMNTRGK